MSADLFDLTGRVAVVTGARRGIGAAMAQALATAGCDIIGVSASLEESGSDVQRAVEATGRRFVGLQADFGDRTAVTDLAAHLTGLPEPIDILINNAGTITRRPAIDQTDDD